MKETPVTLGTNRERNADSWPRHVKKAKKRKLTRKDAARKAQEQRDRADRRL